MATITEGPGELGRKLVANMERMTRDRIGGAALDNARFNLRFKDHGQSLAALRKEKVGENDAAIVIAAGPSVKRKDPLRAIRESGFKGAVVCTESALLYCLRNGVVPDLTVTLDPHATRIVRWFGDTRLTPEKLGADDYYRRQDMDPAFADEMKANQEIMGLLNEHGSKIRIALSSSASEAVVERVMETGMQVYWWNPMLDDPDTEGSKTRELYALNRFPCVNAGGNVGAACWMMASAVLGKKQVALTGMDFSYYGDTPYRNTQYYHEAVSLVGEENLDSVYIRIPNPYTGTEFYTDPAYMWYRETFLQMAGDAHPECQTFNCTEGGILFGDPIVFEPLADFLGRHS
ncbi:hypothetical protein H261_07988 [Paramagnetospirillum caucaseum]|uniref:6-hydroxymethylpterin diphosphokinase MptE-like domain-containing protein n=1 Tax=Paramagnetospirillum caucaseum TaxID=1244869 RepID=M3ADI9_9PROT|nr:DUF115 domain-containing protein [Paramagnetospirillum caucaseum]EME70554.1 hypothetical protein H261_07988 [Paramagnetospirillum caucaseum]